MKRPLPRRTPRPPESNTRHDMSEINTPDLDPPDIEHIPIATPLISLRQLSSHGHVPVGVPVPGYQVSLEWFILKGAREYSSQAEAFDRAWLLAVSLGQPCEMVLKGRLMVTVDVPSIEPYDPNALFEILSVLYPRALHHLQDGLQSAYVAWCAQA